MKTLIMCSAIPASGKSTWANRYKAEHPNVYIVNSDETRMEVTHGDYQDFTHQKEVWELFEKKIHDYAKIKDCTVILDALNDTNEIRLKYLKSTPEFDKKILVLFPGTTERSQKFNSLRDEKVRVPEQILDGLANKFEAPNEEVKSLVDEVIEVSWWY